MLSLMEEYLALRSALKEIRKEAKKGKPDPDRIFLIADNALDATPTAQE